MATEPIGAVRRPHYVCETSGRCCFNTPIEVTDAMVEAGAERISDLLVQLAVDPDFAPDHNPSDTVKRVLARAVLHGAFPRTERSSE